MYVYVYRGGWEGSIRLTGNWGWFLIVLTTVSHIETDLHDSYNFIITLILLKHNNE